MEIYYGKPCESNWQGLRSTQNVPSSLMSKPSFSALDGVDRDVSEGSSGRFEGHFLACRCSLQHHRITIFLLISPDFRGVEEKVRIFLAQSSKVVNVISERGMERLRLQAFCYKSHIHRQLCCVVEEMVEEKGLLCNNIIT